jgi:tRNA-2-methylthio-N6-dimethylallyladenosine synthase
MSKSLFIQTIGCQMNVYDSERMAAALYANGYTAALAPEEADLVIVNTCSVRAKSEQKAFSFLGRLEAAKRRRPGMLVGMAGCVAQQEGARLLARAPYVDLVIGTRAVERLAGMVRRAEAGERPVVELDLALPAGDGAAPEPDPAPARAGGAVSRFITIMRGCDNFCAYCVVPHVRGREASRRPEAIVAEVRAAVETGTREITLLGQNVNSYGVKEGLPPFAELLARVNAMEGLARIRFTTSHPKDLTPALIGAFGRLEKLCPHIHLPVQSGSDRVLERMNRRYTRGHYLDIVSKLRDSLPQIAVTTDMIVGFPGETRADFEATLDLMRQVQFDSLFAFIYSDRPQAPSTLLPDKVPFAEKRERLQELLRLQEAITRRKNALLIGTVQEVMAEGMSKRQATRGGNGSVPQWTGRTPANKVVNFSAADGSGGAGDIRPGRLVPVRIERVLAHSLRGAQVGGPAPGRPEREADHAA